MCTHLKLKKKVENIFQGKYHKNHKLIIQKYNYVL